VGTANNGNVTAITNNRDTTRSQSFSYDSLNRISTAKTASTTGTTCWDEAFGYDPWGNLLTIGRISGYTCSNEELLNLSATPQNRISGDTYDTAGNLTVIPSVATYTFNAENQLTATAGVVYAYGGDGKRLWKAPSSTPTQPNKLYWYGVGSDPLDETDGSGTTANAAFKEYIFFGGKRIASRDSSNTVNYYFADHLGTARIVANSSGTPVDDSDFYPFGGERSYLNSSPQNYKFTGKERDYESGLDNFGARFDSSSMGRFMSPDPIYIEEQKMLDPQQLNLYSYVRNNPLNLTDSTGMLVDVNCQQVSATQCSQTVTDFNNREGAQFQVTRDDKTGQLNVNGDVDPTKLSGGERALYDSITNKDATGTVTVVGNDSSFDFEKSTGKGQNSVDRSDLNALNGADKRLSGEIIAHAAIESYNSAKPGLSVDQAHELAAQSFGFKYGRFTPNFASQVNTLFLNFRSTRLNEDFRATLTLKTPIPMVTFRKMQAESGVLSLPRDVTKATLLP